MTSTNDRQSCMNTTSDHDDTNREHSLLSPCPDILFTRIRLSLRIGTNRDMWDRWETHVEQPVSNDDVVRATFTIRENQFLCVEYIGRAGWRRISLILHVFLSIVHRERLITTISNMQIDQMNLLTRFVIDIAIKACRRQDFFKASLSVILFNVLLLNASFDQWRWTLPSDELSLLFTNHHRLFTDWTCYCWLMFLACEDKSMNDSFLNTTG